jgi:flagellar hook assembly protein FlgD
LNNFYQTNLDNYKDGELTYQLPQMTPGIHTLSLKAWDVLNNSSQKQISFKVLDGNAPVIGKTISYPNPTNGDTKFFFEHNINGEILSITIDIYNIAGLPVSKIETAIEPAGFTSGSIPWDGTGLGGKLLPGGIYLYRITLNSSKGSTQSETKKLIITK